MVINSKSEINDDTKVYLKKNLKPALVNLFKSLNKELADLESDPQKIQEDKVYLPLSKIQIIDRHSQRLKESKP